MFRRIILFLLVLSLLSSGAFYPTRICAFADDKNDKSKPQLSAEQIAESVIFIYSNRLGRNFLEQIRRNGVERGRLLRIANDGRTEDATYERRFVRGENSAKDKVRLDQKLPASEYSLIYGGGRTFGLVNGASFTPRQEAATDFLAQQWHSLDTLLRYKENGSTLALADKETQQGVEAYVLDVTDKEKRRTRYHISVKSLRVLRLDYEEPTAAGGTPVKYMRKFYDYHVVQGTLVPYHTVLFEDGKQTQETRILTVIYGIKMDDALFQSPDAQAST